MAEKTNKENTRWRRIAGTLELFLGSYFAACGCLAVLFFLVLENRDGVLLSAIASLLGMLLVFRAGRLLAWRTWIFRTVAIIFVLGPVIWVMPAFLATSDETSASRHRAALAASIQVRSVRAHDLAPSVSLGRYQPQLDAQTRYAYRKTAALREKVQSITADTFVWCLEKLQSVLHGDTSAPPPPKK